jgi:formate dehydrogenase maturation protein FdhE
MIAKKRRKRFGVLALSKGFINVEQIIEALTIQLRENIEHKKNRPIGQILLELGYINTQEIEELLEPKFEQRFGEIAVAKRFITFNQLLQAMTIQVKEDAESGMHRLLGEIAIDIGLMNASQVNGVLNDMNK